MQIGYSAMGIHKQGMFISFHQNLLRHGCWLAKSSTPTIIFIMFFLQSVQNHLRKYWFSAFNLRKMILS